MNNHPLCHTKQEEKIMRKSKKNFIDKIEIKHGIKYIVRYIDGKEIGKVPYGDFIKYSNNLKKG